MPYDDRPDDYIPEQRRIVIQQNEMLQQAAAMLAALAHDRREQISQLKEPELLKDQFV